MPFTWIAEVLVCIFAVFGLYGIICRLLSFCCEKEHLSIALHMTAEEDGGARLLEGIRHAQYMTEAQNFHMQPPVILLDVAPSEEVLALLRACQYEVYQKQGGEEEI